jgi:pyruvate ferredoxin oxidoreductase gamma subunit
MRGFNCFSGLKEKGLAIINAKDGSIEMPKLKAAQQVFLVPANDIAIKHIGRPLGNTALLGAFCAATAQMSLDELNSALKNRFPEKLQEMNIKAAKEGFDYIKSNRGKFLGPGS